MYFEQFTEGARFETEWRTVRESDLTAFLGVSGMFEEVFMNSESDERVIPPGAIPGIMALTLAEGLVVLRGLMRRGLAFLGMTQWEMSAPVVIGDRIRADVLVANARPCSSRHAGIVRLDQSIIRHSAVGDVTVSRYETKRMIARRRSNWSGVSGEGGKDV